jgi:hypothetical protein
LRINPATGEVLEVLRGRAFQRSRTKYLRRIMAQQLAAVLAQARLAATPAAIPDNACQRAPEERAL